ncbi:calcium-binding protein P-like [Oppia nitens]|uniref:calcium-binding protein P-like n=1 Tax=Oppia nitens TaxID=1686743 RepID=UPI0023DBCADE|nr:calcium-binding protein P-like [Oppia nitens]
MNLLNTVVIVYLALTLTASVSYCLEEYDRYVPDNDGLTHERSIRVKRKGGKGGGGRGRGSSSRKSSTKTRPADPYPKQPAHNPNYPTNANPNAPAYPAYPKQPPPYPGQTGQSFPGQHGNPGQTGYNQPNYGYGSKLGGVGGMGTGMGSGLGNMGKSKSGIGALGAGALGGAAGAALGAYGGYKLGRMVGGLGSMGHYGYYDDRYKYVKCDPPPKIEFDPQTNITYIPKTIEYDARCHYYDQRPPHVYPGYERWGVNAAPVCTPTWSLATILATILVFGFRFQNLNRFQWDFWSHLLLT